MYLSLKPNLSLDTIAALYKLDVHSINEFARALSVIILEMMSNNIIKHILFVI